MLTAYFDMSATETSIGVTSIAGYVAPEGEWNRIAVEWREALTLWNLDSFHFTGLPRSLGHERGAVCAAYFANIITRSSADGIGAALVDAHWEQSDWGDMNTQREATKYEQCFAMALTLLSQHVRQEFPGERVRVVCDRDANSDEIERLFDRFKAAHRVLESVRVSHAPQEVPLQCSDLAAGKLRKSWLKFFTPEGQLQMWGEFPRGRRLRSSFWSLVPGVVLTTALHRGGHLVRREALDRGSSV